MRDGRVDVSSFARDTLPLATRHVGHGAHVVGAVSELDQDNPNIPRHREQHFSERLGLVFFAVIELEFFEFGQAIHQVGNRNAKFLGHFNFGDTAVLKHVVHERSHEGLGV